MIEIWKDIPGYIGYQASNLGNIKSLARTTIAKNNNIMYFREKILVPQSTCGYSRVLLTIRRQVKKNTSVHRLAALAHIPNPNNHPVVNHKDGNKLNNHIDNLEWCTYSENTIHSLTIGSRKSGHNHKAAKLTLEQVKEIKRLYLQGITQRALSGIYNIDNSQICRIVNNKKWKYV